MQLSELEELILLGVGSLYPDAYAYAIKKELKAYARRNLALATIHTALYRLEQRGLLRSTLGGQTQKRGGRSKRLFVLTQAGHAALQDTRAVRETLWERMQPASGMA